MKITSFVKSIILPDNEGPTSKRGGLQIGDRLVGKVLELKGVGRAFVDFGRFRALADVGFPVRQGETIHVEVMNKGAPLRLQRVQSEAGRLRMTQQPPAVGEFPSSSLLKRLQSQIKPLLSDIQGTDKGKTMGPELQNAVRNIATHFAPVDPDKGTRHIGRQLRGFMENAGLFYEKKIEKAVEQFMMNNRGAASPESGHIPGTRNMADRDLKSNLLMLRELVARKTPFLKGLAARNPEVFQKTAGSPPMGDPKAPVSQESGHMPELKSLADKDLKANLLVLRDFLGGKDPALKILAGRDPEAFQKTVEKFLSEITSRQNDAGNRVRSEPVLVYTYLIPMKDLDEEAKVKAYYGRKKGSASGEGFKVSLLLNFEKMGPVRSDLFLKNKRLTVDFYVSDSRIREHLDDHLADVAAVLDDIFESVSIKVALSEKEISEFEFEDMVPLNRGLIDLRV